MPPLGDDFKLIMAKDFKVIIRVVFAERSKIKTRSEGSLSALENRERGLQKSALFIIEVKITDQRIGDLGAGFAAPVHDLHSEVEFSALLSSPRPISPLGVLRFGLFEEDCKNAR
ncbi:MAG: hypothetical protein R2827_14440 [Bdellovibrionales bacterium]